MRASKPVLLLACAACAAPPSAPLSAATPAASSSPAAPASSAASLPSSAPPAPAASSAPVAPDAWPASLGAPSLPAPGPIAAVGYPTPIRKCLPDPADHAGFTTDTGEFGYCAHGMAWRCELVDRDGHRRVESTAASGDSPAESPAKSRALEAWMKTHLPALKVGNCLVTPDRLAGTWAYSDITVEVVSAPPSLDGDRLLSQPFVRIGGTVAGAARVLPVMRSAPHLPLSAPGGGEIPFNVVELNAMVLSPDGKELGLVVHSYCGEWCDDFQVDRMSTAHFAALVYNDTGYAAYRKGDLAKAADLFLRAAAIDPGAELPAYNLACAFARLGDARARAALELAVARGGERVRERARKDADFDAVRGAAWFGKATATP